MQMHLVAVGKRMPGWIVDGFAHYQRQLPQYWRFGLVEVGQSRYSEPGRRKLEEGLALLKHCPSPGYVVALDEAGQQLGSVELAAQVRQWEALGDPVRLLIGGPDGLDAAVRERANWCWSLSPLTLPHPLVRVLMVEQLYRAHTINANHPYHRA